MSDQEAPKPLTIGNGKPGPGRPKLTHKPDPQTRRSLKEAERLHKEAVEAYNSATDNSLIAHWSKEVRARHELVTKLRGDLYQKPSKTYGLDPDTLERIAQDYRDASSTSPRQCADEAAQFLRQYNTAYPDDARYIYRVSKPKRFDVPEGDGEGLES